MVHIGGNWLILTALPFFAQLVKTYISHKALREDLRTHPLLTTTDSPFEACGLSVLWRLFFRPEPWKHAIIRSEKCHPGKFCQRG